MTRHIVSAIFNHRNEADRALAELHAAGVDDRDISMLHRDTDEHRRHHDHDEHDKPDNKASGTAKGLGIGAGVGAVAGVGAIFIPGIGPFLAMGAVAETLGLIGSAAATSAAVGAAAGGIAGALMDYGVREEDARHFDRRLNEGGIWIGVDADRTSLDAHSIARILDTAGGETAPSNRTLAH